jgi:hypothetical protein
MTKNVWLAIGVSAVMSALWIPTGSAQAPSQASNDPARALSRAELDALLQHPESLLIVDVRRPDELSSIGGFGVYLSIQPANVEKSLA